HGGFAADDGGCERLSAENAKEQSYRCAGPSGIEHGSWRFQSIQASAMDSDLVVLQYLDTDLHPSETIDGTETVLTKQKVFNFSCAACKSTYNDRSVGYGLVAGYCDFSP